MTDQTLLTICLNDFDHLQSKCGINRFENKNGSAVPDAAQNIGGNMGDAFETRHRQVREGPQDASLVGLSHFLASIPSPRAVLEYLVIDLLSDYNLRAAWLASPAESGYFAEIASYGCFESRAFDAHRPAVWSNDPMATAITANEPVITRVRETRENGQNNTPFLAEEISFAAVMPVQPNQESRFVLGVGCAGAAEDARACLESLMETRPLLAIYLAFLRTGPDESDNNTTHAAESTDLTPRQSTILQLIAQGMKNREIAFTIGFSESTVRLDTIEIYRKLGVQGRHEAARVALRLGILDPDDIAHQGAHKLADP